MIIFDFETRGTSDVTVYGVDVHAPKLTEVTLLTWVYTDQPGINHVWYPAMALPDTLFERVRDGELLMAWNSRYDRKVWNEAAVRLHGFPEVPMEQFIDLAAQGRASLLPSSLDQASKALHLRQKPRKGQKAMKEYAQADKCAPVYDMTDPTFKAFVAYGIHDVVATLRILQRTRALSDEEWWDFIISEDINDRGIGIDVTFCAAAAELFDVVKEENRQSCLDITHGEIKNVTYHKAIAQWVYNKLSHELQEIMVVEADEEGNPLRLSLDSKKVLPQLLDKVKTSDAVMGDDVYSFLELLEHARSNSAGKFIKMMRQQVGGRLYGSFMFNGAGQTGRYSSTGVQVHNLPRAKVADEEAAMVDIIAKVPPDVLKRRYGPLGKVLAQLARPSLIAPKGRSLVWGDWSAIEARVLPWLANSKSAERVVLDVFRACDLDPDLPDLYVQTAADIFGHDDITDKERQAGKVAVLALGFGGHVGAYRAMSRGYGMSVNDEQGLLIVEGWRDRNRWAKMYWYQLWDAAVMAIRCPGIVQPAGRVNYLFDQNLMGGTLLCYLPCGRPIVYPRARYEEEYDEQRKKTRKVLTFMSGGHRFHTWYGKLAENITQATAASLLRASLRELNGKTEVVMHTHDEIVCECDEDDTNRVIKTLEDVMTTSPAWAGGLPLSSEIKTHWYYTKGV